MLPRAEQTRTLTTSEVCRLLNTSKWTIYRMIETEQLPRSCWFKVGRQYRFLADELRKWMAGS